MTEPISEEMSPLWYIYNDGFPDFLAELLEAEELQRLKRWECTADVNTAPSPCSGSPRPIRDGSSAWEQG